MSVIEGYSDYVMHHVGRGLVPHYEDLKERMARSRSHRPPLETAVFRLTGLDVKLEQYSLGERSPTRSSDARGWRASTASGRAPKTCPRSRRSATLASGCRGWERPEMENERADPSLGYEFAREEEASAAASDLDRRFTESELSGLRIYRVRWNGNYLVEADLLRGPPRHASKTPAPSSASRASPSTRRPH